MEYNKQQGVFTKLARKSLVRVVSGGKHQPRRVICRTPARAERRSIDP